MQPHCPIAWLRNLPGLCLAVMCMGQPRAGSAQNLVPNPSFEDHAACPSFGNHGIELAPPWYSTGPMSSCDYFHECATFWSYGVPNNVFGGQFARTGAAYAGGHSHGAFREYAQVPLTQTLQAGHCYKVGFYLNLGDSQCGTDRFGALLTADPVANPLGMIPQVDLGGALFTEKVGWVFIFNYIIAQGDEAYLTIGNFYTDPETTVDPSCEIPGQGLQSYYFFEDVVVEEVPIASIDVELDGPVTACDSFTIEPDIYPEVEDVVYVWSDGSRGSTLTVSASGEYAVTVYYGCDSDEASIEVEIIHPPALDLGDDLDMCAGETFTISLDPDLGQFEWQDGYTSPTYTIASTGQYAVSIDNGCVVVADTVEVLVTDPPPPFSLGDELILCPGDVHVLAFDPSLGDFEWQDGSTASTYTVSVEGTYSLTITNACGEASDEVEAVDVVPPAFDLGPDTLIRCTGEIVDIELDPTLGSFLWQNGSNSNSYVISTGGLYSVTVTNECGVETDSVLAIYTAPPAIDLGPDQALCLGDTVILTGGNNSGVYAWQDGSSSTTYAATGTGTYALTITHPCGTDRDTVDLLFASPPPQPDLGPDQTICPGETITLRADIPGSSLSWNDGSTADSLLITLAGTYAIQATNACGTDSDTIVITATAEPPAVQLPDDFTLCIGDSVTLQTNLDDVSFTWSDGSQGPSFQVFTPGTYHVTVSNLCGADSDTIMVADGGLAPVLSLGLDTSICAGSTYTLVPASTGVETWLWQDGSTLPTFTVTAAGAYHAVGQNACGSVTDTIHIGLLPSIPPLSLGADTSLCEGEALSLTIDIPDVDILWYNGSMSPSISVAAPVTVHAMISNSCGASVDTMRVQLSPATPELDLGPDVALCPGKVITIAPGIQNVTYTWQDGSTDPTYPSTAAETIILTIANACGMSSDTMVVVESTLGPQLDLGPDISACVGDTVRIAPGISGVDFLWQDGSTTSVYNALQTGTLVLRVSNACGTDTDTIDVIIEGVAPTVRLGSDTLLCDESTLLLVASAEASAAITWQDGTTTLDYLVTQPGRYSVQATNGCGSASDTIEVTYLASPDPFTLGTDTVLCAGETLALHQPSTPYTFAWQDGSATAAYLVSEPGSYSGVVTNFCGLTSDTIQVFYSDEQPALGLDTMIAWCAGQSIVLDATQPFPATYHWSTGEESPSITATAPGHYQVAVQTRCGNASAALDIVPDPACGTSSDIDVPNIFSPNGDGVNDAFIVMPGADITLLSMTGTIYDRWGNVVYSASAIPFVWDGRFDHQDVLPGVYVYLLDIRYSLSGNEMRSVLRGDVTVMR